jgi:hypothetical protein
MVRHLRRNTPGGERGRIGMRELPAWRANQTAMEEK